MTKKEWLIAAILTFITVCAWVVFDILHKSSSSQQEPETQEIIEPVDPNFRTDILEKLP